jgi:nitronate monooxygenase
MLFPFRPWRSVSGARITFPAGKPPRLRTGRCQTHEQEEPRELAELCVVSNFVEVFLAREGHRNPVGINYLEKVQIPHLPSLYGAMLAGVGYVLMGAGIPLHVPGVLDRLAEPPARRNTRCT